MLDDILEFAAQTLVDSGRLSFWMPTANDEDQEIPVPSHPCFELVVVCVQVFNKCEAITPYKRAPTAWRRVLTGWPGSRRLMTYRRLPDDQVSESLLQAYEARKNVQHVGTTADELNPFRRGYFRKFETQD